MEFRLKALTPIWTGGIEGKNDKLHVTGIKGSIRWWYEVLIRGLDCYACDPTANGHCELKPKELNRDQPLTKQIKDQICPACYMFGCTGWSGKFNLRIKDEKGRIKREQLEVDDSFVLEFVERKEFAPAEKKLLKMTLKLIVDYGAIGGKTILKPSEKDYKNVLNYGDGRHYDYGVIGRLKNANGIDISKIPSGRIYYGDTKEMIDGYLQDFTNKTLSEDWPDLRNFWFAKGLCIDRERHNIIVNRDETHSFKNYKTGTGSLQIWLGGKQEVSKKIFSFHGIDPDAKIKKGNTHADSDLISGVRRCFGYSKKNELKEVIKLVIGHIKSDDSSLSKKIICSMEVLDEL